MIYFYPTIAKYFGNWSGWNYLIRIEAPRHQLFQETIRNHQKTLEEGFSRDLIDCYLHEVERTTDPESIFHKSNAGGRTHLRILNVFHM